MKFLKTTENKLVVTNTVSFSEYEIEQALLEKYRYELQDVVTLNHRIELYEGCGKDDEFSQEEREQFAELIFTKEIYHDPFSRRDNDNTKFLEADIDF